MIELIVTALLRALDALEQEDDDEYAFHCGEAGGIATAAGIFGVRALELCDDISSAYEDTALDFMRYILREASERPSDDAENYARTRDSDLNALEFGSALGEAMKAKAEGDASRHSLMIGFTAGLMFRYRGPDGGVQGSVLDKIMEAYRTDCDELLLQAHGTLGFGARMSDPMGFMGKADAARYYEERVRTMRWVQNFGLRDARSGDGTVAIPNALSINYQLVQQAGEAGNAQIADDTEYEELEFFDEEDLMPVEDQAVGDANAQDPATWVLEGISKGEQGDLDGAVADFGRAIELDPGYALAYLNRGNARSFQGNSEAAIIDFDRAVTLDPGNAEAFYNRGIAKASLGDYEAAIADYGSAIERDANHVSAYINRGIMQGVGGDYIGAISDFDRAIELDPNNAAAYSNRGTAKSHMDDHDGAMADYNRAIELDPK